MKKISNKVLVIGLGSLIAIFVLAKLFRSPKLESNLRKELTSLDTAAISELKIAKGGDVPSVIRLFKQNNVWMVSQDAMTFQADKSVVSGIVATIGNLRAERMASRSKDKWESFNVADKGTNVSVYVDGEKEAEFRVGKTGIDQSGGGMGNQFGGQGGIKAYTYIRMSDEDEVYIVDGFLEPTFNRGISEWRDKSFTRFTSDQVTKVTFTYPADSSFVLEKRDSTWSVSGRPADKNKVEGYLRTVSYNNQSMFAGDNAPGSSVTAVIKFEGTSGTVATVEGWKLESGWILHSSLQPAVYFSNNDQRSINEMFVGQKNF